MTLLAGLRDGLRPASRPWSSAAASARAATPTTATVTMTAEEAEAYHARRSAAFAETDADLVSGLTLPTVEEALGIARAAVAAGMPVVISFTVETDGRLPSGQTLAEAIEQVDAETDGAPRYFMINCAHPDALRAGAGGWRRVARADPRHPGKRLEQSHAELDELGRLDAGDPEELADRIPRAAAAPAQPRVLGGCCGTDHRHIAAIAEAWLAE